MNHIYQEEQFGEDWFSYPNLYKSMVDKFPAGSKFVEVGSWKGKSSAYMAVEIANSNKSIDFFCVDTWKGSIEHIDFPDLESLYETFTNNMKPLSRYHIPMRMPSLEAAKEFEDKSLDFVFIDASHEYEDVKDDIKAWLPKIKPGGVLAGHDYYVDIVEWAPGVRKAVHEELPSFTTQENCWVYQIPKGLIDFAYVINLGRDYNSICQKFWQIPKHKEIPFFVSYAVNGLKVSNLTEELPFTWSIYKDWKLNEDLSWWNRDVTPGELGCALSHFWVWKAAYEGKVGNTLFLEEDFSIQDWPTEDEWNSVPEDWDMIYLGRKLVPGHEDQPVNEHIVRVGYSYNMHAYILSQEGLRKVLNTPFLTNIIPTDEFMPAVIGVHPREDVTKLFHLEDFNAYAFSRKNFVWQESNTLTSQTENVSNVRDIRDWDYWKSMYLNPNFITKDYESISKQCITQGGVLQFPLFTEDFCDEVIGLVEYASKIIRKKEGSQLNIPLNNLFLHDIYNKVIIENVFPFLNWYWDTTVRNVFACKSNMFKYEDGKIDLKIIQEHESVYCMGLRLTNIDPPISYNEYLIPSKLGNVVIHPTILTENYEGKKFVYDNSHCILSFF